MGVTIDVLRPGNGRDKPKEGDVVTIEYTGHLYDEGAEGGKGKVFDTSVGREDFQTAIGVGQVIRGWDEGVQEMSLGEKSILIISGDYAYGSRGFPNLIPPNATLLFEVNLKAINNQKA